MVTRFCGHRGARVERKRKGREKWMAGENKRASKTEFLHMKKRKGPVRKRREG